MSDLDQTIDSSSQNEVHSSSTLKLMAKWLMLAMLFIILISGVFFALTGGKKNTDKNGSTSQPTVTSKAKKTNSEILVTENSNAPVFFIYGASEGKVNEQIVYTMEAKANKGTLTKIEIWIAKKGDGKLDEWIYTCDGKITTFGCNLKTLTSSKEKELFYFNWTPEAKGTYYITANVYNSEKGACAGNQEGFVPGQQQCKELKPIILDVK